MRELGERVSDSGPELEGKTLSTDELSDVEPIPTRPAARIAAVVSSGNTLMPVTRNMDPSGPTAARLRSATFATARTAIDSTVSTSGIGEGKLCIVMQRI